MYYVRFRAKARKKVILQLCSFLYFPVFKFSTRQLVAIILLIPIFPVTNLISWVGTSGSSFFDFRNRFDDKKCLKNNFVRYINEVLLFLRNSENKQGF